MLGEVFTPVARSLRIGLNQLLSQHLFFVLQHVVFVFLGVDFIDQTPQPVVLTDAARAVIAARQEEIRQILTARSQRARVMARTHHTFIAATAAYR